MKATLLPGAMLLFFSQILLGSHVEIFPFLGVHEEADFETGIVCFRAPCPSFGRIETGTLLGMAVDLWIARHLDLEILASRQSANVKLDSIVMDILPDGDLHTTSLLAGLRGFESLGNWEVFGVFGAGMNHLSWDLPYIEAAESSRFAFSLGGGVKVRAGSRIGFRAETRGEWTDMPEVLATAGGFQFEFMGGVTVKLN